MTFEQRKTYFRLWNLACKVQGWDAKDDHVRQRTNFASTGEASSRDMDNGQITLLFNKLGFLADPTSYDKALADSDPMGALISNERRQLIWRITDAAAKVPGNPEAWLSEMAADRFGHSDWRKLSPSDLLRFSMMAAGETTAKAVENRANKQAAKKPRKPAKKRPAHGMQDACKVYGQSSRIEPEDEAIFDMPF